jgi:hypothetical protein
MLLTTHCSEALLFLFAMPKVLYAMKIYQFFCCIKCFLCNGALLNQWHFSFLVNDIFICSYFDIIFSFLFACFIHIFIVHSITSIKIYNMSGSQSFFSSRFYILTLVDGILWELLIILKKKF